MSPSKGEGGKGQDAGGRPRKSKPKQPCNSPTLKQPSPPLPAPAHSQSFPPDLIPPPLPAPPCYFIDAVQVHHASTSDKAPRANVQPCSKHGFTLSDFTHWALSEFVGSNPPPGWCLLTFDERSFCGYRYWGEIYLLGRGSPAPGISRANSWSE